MHDRRFARGEDGQMLVIFSLCLVAIIAMTGLVIDGGMTFVQKREQQNVADAAALAGAYAYVNSGNESDAGTAAQAIRETLNVPPGGVPLLPFAVLAAWCVVGLAFAYRSMSRRT